jgi:hypothetical protein
MLVRHPANDRFHSDFGWLDSQHSFSFGEHYDPSRLGFRNLRVINDDRIAGGGGFPTHGHRDMEILTWVLEGGVAHRDNTGGSGVIRPGELQHMTAGRGIMHSEFNASQTEALRLLQIWIEPSARGLPPEYSQLAFPAEGRANRLQLLAARGTQPEGVLPLAADAALYVAELTNGATVRHEIAAGRHAWVQVATGTVTVNGQTGVEGDGFALSEEAAVEISGTGQVLVFDLG